MRTVSQTHAPHGGMNNVQSLHSFGRHGCSAARRAGRRCFASEALLAVDTDPVIVRQAVKATKATTQPRRKTAAQSRTKSMEEKQEAISKPRNTTKTTKKTADANQRPQLYKDDIVHTETPLLKSRRSKKELQAVVPLNLPGKLEEAICVVETLTPPKRIRKPRAAKSENIHKSEPNTVVRTELRGYQKECIETCLANLKKGIMRQIVSLPVGSGKTTVSIDQGKKIAVMSADVIVASVPSLGRLGSPRLLQYDPRQFKCIIIDEAHHAAADSYGRILKHFGADVPNTHIFVYGCSATVRRHDGLRLSDTFDYISFHKGFVTMIEDKWLCGLRVSTIQTDFDLKDVKMQGGDFSQKDLAVKVNTPIRNDIVVRSYMTYCAERKSTVVFAVDIAHLEVLTEAFRSYGYDARGLSSLTGDIERAQLLRDFRERKFPIIVNCGILTEGTDIPCIDSIVMARPTKSNVLFQQMLGRGMRLYPGKEDCLVLDFVDVVRGDGLVTLPTLLGLEPSSVLKKDFVVKSQADVEAILEEQLSSLGIDAQQSQSNTEEVIEEVMDPLKGIKVARIRVLEYDNPYQLLGDCSGTSSKVWEMSSNAWVKVGEDAYVLTFKSITFKIEKSPQDRLWRCQKRVNLGSTAAATAAAAAEAAPGKSSNKIWKNKFGKYKNNDDNSKSTREHMLSKGTMLPIKSDTLQDCFHGVDTWIAKNIGHFPQMLGRHAKWRKSEASDSQLRFLRKLGYDHDALSDGGEVGSDPAFYREQKLKRLNKGQAANMITRLVHGAGKEWKDSKKFKAQRARAFANEIGVDVGPISKVIEV
ncbi:hypothetical protein BG004_000057 [Podila humilis]|nr:hypothetical protein BG004_000057 [Podila humilis]